MASLSMQPNNKNGFTFVELIVIVAIIGVLAAISIPSFMSWRPNIYLKGTARDLYSEIQKARLSAVKTNRKSAVIFDTSKNQYTVCDNWNTTTNTCVGTQRVVALGDSLLGIGYGHGNATDPVVGTGFGDIVTYTDDVVVFNAQGMAEDANDGYVYIDHQDHTTTYAIGSQASGVVEIKRWQQGSWQ